MLEKTSFDEQEEEDPSVEVARRDYRQWYNKDHIERQVDLEQVRQQMQECISHDGNYWLE